MVQYIFMALLLVLASLMLWYSGMRRLMVFIIAITFVPYLVSIPAPFLPSYRLFCLAVIVSAMLRTGSFVEQMRRLPCLVGRTSQYFTSASSKGMRLRSTLFCLP